MFVCIRQAQTERRVSLFGLGRSDDKSGYFFMVFGSSDGQRRLFMAAQNSKQRCCFFVDFW